MNDITQIDQLMRALQVILLLVHMTPANHIFQIGRLCPFNTMHIL